MASLASAYIIDKQVMEKFCKGDKGAFEQLYVTYAPLLLGMILKILPNEQDTEKVLQQTFFEIWGRKCELMSIEGSLFLWMIGIARKFALETSNNNILENEIQNGPNVVNITVDPDQMAIEKENKTSRAPANVQDLSVFDLIYRLGYSIIDVSKLLGMPVDMVSKTLRKNMNHLKFAQND